MRARILRVSFYSIGSLTHHTSAVDYSSLQYKRGPCHIDTLYEGKANTNEMLKAPTSQVS
jgi:hypothetical protein